MGGLPETASTSNTAAAARANPNKRKADALGRLAQSKSQKTKTGRGALVGWTTCPLCTTSTKQFALGRGIAAHLHAVHTPWKPSNKLMQQQQKKRRRQEARRRRARHVRRRDAATSEVPPEEKDTVSHDEDDSLVVVEPWEPTVQEREAWEERVIQIVQDLESTASRPNNTGVDRSGRPSRPYRDSLPPFLQAAADGQLETLQSMVQTASSNNGDDNVLALLDTRDRHLSIAEHWAAGGGHLECLKYLYELRRMHLMTPLKNTTAAVAKVRRRDGKTCLHYAARNGHVACVVYLLEQGHNVNQASGDGTTPIHMACFGGHVSVVQLLMDRGASLQATNEWGCTAAHWIGMTRSDDDQDIRKLCRLLQKAGVSFVEPQKQGHCALHKACQKQNRSVIDWMVQSTDEGGAGLSPSELEQAGRPDAGGHTPSEIWQSVGGDPAFARWMRDEMKW